MTTHYHSCKISDRALNCFSDAADYNYILFIKDPRKIDKAEEIAEKELELWGCPDNAPVDLYDYYYNAGYCEVVETALENEGIEVLCYDNIDDEVEPEEYLDKELDIFSSFIAEQLDFLSKTYDLYEYKDQVDDEEEHVAMLKKCLESGDTKDIKTFLRTLTDDDTYSINDKYIDIMDDLRADNVLKKIDEYESMKAAKEVEERQKIEQDTKAMSQFLGKKLLPRRGR